MFSSSSSSVSQLPDQEILSMLAAGMEAFQKEQYTEAIKSLTKVIEAAPDHLDAYFYLSACFSALNLPAEALRYMEQARRLCPEKASIYYNLGTLCHQLGRKAEAKKYFEQALTVAKTDQGLSDRKGFEKRVKQELAKIDRWKLF